MFTRNVIAAAVIAFGCSAVAALAQSPGLGKPLTEADIKQWDIAIMPDGSNLPPGSGTPAKGAKIFAEKCSAYHGNAGRGGVAASSGAQVARDSRAARSRRLFIVTPRASIAAARDC